MHLEVEEILKVMTPELYERFQRAVEIGKWPDGRRLTQSQVETCLQALIAYELHNLPPEQRTGYVPPKGDACDAPSDTDDIQSLNWQ